MSSLVKNLNLSENAYAVYFGKIFNYRFYESNITIFVIMSVALSMFFALIINIYLNKKIQLIRNKFRTNLS